MRRWMTGWRRIPAGVRAVIILVSTALIVLLLAASGAAALSRSYWGYWCARPEPDSRVLEAEAALSVTPVELSPGIAGGLEFVPSQPYAGPGWYDTERAMYPQEFDYYLLERRVLHELELRGVITTALPGVGPERLLGLMARVQGTGQLLRDRPGYSHLDAQRTLGVIYELTAADGTPLLLVALRGSEASNDHYPYYELLFEGRLGGAMTLLSTRRFYFDVAGIEGAEFSGFFRFFAAAGLTIGLPISGLALLVLWLRRAAAARVGHCPRCRYDLLGNLAGGCPECGWGSVDSVQ